MGSFDTPMTVIHVLNGPNLNLLGKREPQIYGSSRLEDIHRLMETRCMERGATLVFKQSNHEGDLVTWIQEAGEAKAPVILNPGALTHTSIALYDAVKGWEAEVIEVHLSKVHSRESFRRHSYVSPAARGVIAGFGPASYLLALAAIFEKL